MRKHLFWRTRRDNFAVMQDNELVAEHRGVVEVVHRDTIAYSEADGIHGFFWGADKRQEATDLAIKHCENDGGKDCVVVEDFRNHRHWDDDDNTGFPYLHCGALAVAKEKSSKISNWSAKSALNRGEAEDAAISACEADGSAKCKIRECVCT